MSNNVYDLIKYRDNYITILDNLYDIGNYELFDYVVGKLGILDSVELFNKFFDYYAMCSIYLLKNFSISHNYNFINERFVETCKYSNQVFAKYIITNHIDILDFNYIDQSKSMAIIEIYKYSNIELFNLIKDYLFNITLDNIQTSFEWCFVPCPGTNYQNRIEIIKFLLQNFNINLEMTRTIDNCFYSALSTLNEEFIKYAIDIFNIFHINKSQFKRLYMDKNSGIFYECIFNKVLEYLNCKFPEISISQD